MMKILANLDFSLIEMDQPTFAACASLPKDAAVGTVVFDAAKQRLRLRVAVDGQLGWLTINASGFSPDPE